MLQRFEVSVQGFLGAKGVGSQVVMAQSGATLQGLNNEMVACEQHPSLEFTTFVKACNDLFLQLVFLLDNFAWPILQFG